MRCTRRFENLARANGYSYVCGIDEVGRGAIFGVVTAAAVILNPKRHIKGLNDSKKLSARTRERLAKEIKEKALAYAIVDVPHSEIDKVNVPRLFPVNI